MHLFHQHGPCHFCVFGVSWVFLKSYFFFFFTFSPRDALESGHNHSSSSSPSPSSTLASSRALRTRLQSTKSPRHYPSRGRRFVSEIVELSEEIDSLPDNVVVKNMFAILRAFPGYSSPSEYNSRIVSHERLSVYGPLLPCHLNLGWAGLLLRAHIACSCVDRFFQIPPHRFQQRPMPSRGSPKLTIIFLGNAIKSTATFDRLTPNNGSFFNASRVALTLSISHPLDIFAHDCLTHAERPNQCMPCLHCSFSFVILIIHWTI